MQTLLLILAFIGGGLISGMAGAIGERATQLFAAMATGRRSDVDGFGRHFRNVRAGQTDLLVFTLTAKPMLPLTDCLYLEFVRHMLQTGRVRHAMLTIWWPDGDDPSDTTRLSTSTAYFAYLSQLFDGCRDRVSVVERSGNRPLQAVEGFSAWYPTAGLSTDPLPPLFWRILKQLSRREFYATVRGLGLPARSLRHMIRSRPGDQVLEGLVAHAIYNASIAPAVVQRLHDVGKETDAELVLSILIWELEVDRLAAYYELYSRQRMDAARVNQFSFNVVLGKTIRRSRRAASDNSDEALLLGLAPRAELQVDRLRLRRKSAALRRFFRSPIRNGAQVGPPGRTRGELRGYVAALETILVKNYAFTTPRRQWSQQGRSLLQDWKSTNDGPEFRRLPRVGYQLVFLLHELRARSLPTTPAPRKTAKSTARRRPPRPKAKGPGA